MTVPKSGRRSRMCINVSTDSLNLPSTKFASTSTVKLSLARRALLKPLGRDKEMVNKD